MDIPTPQPVKGMATTSKRFAVQNKQASNVQITAEQLLREAVERQADEARPRKQRIVDEDDLADYRLRRRKDYEDTLRRQRHHIGTWVKYATWEAAQKEFRRARSIFERALNIDYQNTSLWAKYIEMEVKNKFVQSARNLYDRVTHLLPRQDPFWFKYAHMEELLGNYAGARGIFEKWMAWEPNEKAWLMFVHFEERCGEITRGRDVFERFVCAHTTETSFLKFARFEEKHQNVQQSRYVYEKATDVMTLTLLTAQFFTAWSQFEERQKQHVRSLEILREAMAKLPEKESVALEATLMDMQRRHGSKDSITSTVLSKRRKLYEKELEENPRNYDAWFDLIKLEEAVEGNRLRVVEVYEKAVANSPPVAEKKYWRRYIYLWLFYAVYQEKTCGSDEKQELVASVFRRAADMIPWKRFSFGKLWIQWAEFEMRGGDVTRVRKTFGRAIAESGKQKIFDRYSSFELKLGHLDRCRQILAKLVERYPFDARSWVKLMDLEETAADSTRFRGIAEIALRTDFIEQPEKIWKAYIAFEVALREYGRARNLYERLVEETWSPKVIRSFAQFELQHAKRPDHSRLILENGIDAAKLADRQEDRAKLIAYLLKLETDLGNEAAAETVRGRMPKKITKKTAILDADGNPQGWEELTAYEFPEDQSARSTLKILEAAKAWRRQKASVA